MSNKILGNQPTRAQLEAFARLKAPELAPAMELIKQRLVECQDVLVGETDDTLLRRAQGRAGAYKDMLDAADAARELLNKGR